VETFVGAFLLSAALVSLMHGSHLDDKQPENTLPDDVAINALDQTTVRNSGAISASTTDTPQESTLPVPDPADAAPTVHCQPQGPVYRTLVLPYQE
jgi:hypothetical protein